MQLMGKTIKSVRLKSGGYKCILGKSFRNPVAAPEGDCLKRRVLTRNQNNKSNSKSYPSRDGQCHMSAMVIRFSGSIRTNCWSTGNKISNRNYSSQAVSLQPERWLLVLSQQPQEKSWEWRKLCDVSAKRSFSNYQVPCACEGGIWDTGCR